ncbi:MAG: sulfurtransferase [Candidatus Limnocylindrales bacterium]
MSLMSVEELAHRLPDPRLRIVDTRWYLQRPGDGRAAYAAGHIPGAIHLDLDSDLSAATGPGRHPLPDPTEFCARIEAYGIGTDDMVVAYDDAGGTTAARLWWMLDNLGHHNVLVLDGGIQAWAAAGNELATDETHWHAASLTLRDDWRNVIDRDELSARLGEVTLLDARAPDRYRGEVEPIDPKAGHIPTALSAPASANLDPHGRLLPAIRLRGRYSALAVPGQPLVTSCGSGTTACHHALAMRVAGLPDPLLYVGSFSDWSEADMPVAVGDAPGEPLAGARR